MPNTFFVNYKGSRASYPLVRQKQSTPCRTGSTIVMLGMTLCNVHTSQVTASVTLESTTTQTSQTQNTTAFLIKDVPLLAQHLYRSKEK